MGKIIDCDPAAYPLTSTSEMEANAIFRAIIPTKYVKVYLNEMDKVPNYDGYLEITNDNQVPFGKIEVQMKKLSERNLDNPKYQCDLKFLSYCENSILPVFLIVVDTTNNLAYWKWIDLDFLRQLTPSIEAKSININIPKENIIIEGNHEYLTKWIEIIKDYQKRVSDYNDLQRTHELLVANSEPLLNSENEEFKNIHVFLDRLNFQYDTYLNTIKKIHYPNCWKLGLAYKGYEDHSIIYLLYPININKNDLQIRKFSADFANKLDENGLSSTMSMLCIENPIRSRPKEYADELVIKKTKELIRNKALDLNHLYLAEELFFSFVDRYHKYLGLEIKDEYEIDEINFGLSSYFPLFIEESAKKIDLDMSSNPVIDIDLLISQLNNEALQQIETNVKTRIAEEQYSDVPFFVTNRTYSMRRLYGIVDYIRGLERKTIQRIYAPADFSRLKEKDNDIWNAYSAEDIHTNVELLYKQSIEIYNSILGDLFPLLVQSMRLFKNYDRLIVVIDRKKSSTSRPTVTSYYLQNENIDEQLVDVFLQEQDENPFKSLKEAREMKDNTIIDGQKYKILTFSHGFVPYIFEPLPMYNYICDLLIQKVDEIDFDSDLSL
ncbi:DUF4365 domain-containing protein [Methanolobus bombayensis]|uniref:DUF4365 domain-containing protein n=1 Tax=Methanolobus bombayensis TaxID=38023 RepID=UPI001AE6D3E9|nr:DUF4365 domain-containing protein [Methanolobus bombayensis]MBP1909076.1 hypothetical protein [Methanolobus bombayensis]